MNVIWNSVKKYRVLWIFSIAMLLMAVVSLGEENSRQYLIYSESLDKVVATVQGEEITLLDFAVYVAYQEAETHKQALVYNPNNSKEYWGIHTNGQFVRVAVRNAAIQMAIHDELFYQLSAEWNITLTQEEQKTLQNNVDDFWYDLTDYDKQERLGINKEDLYNAMYKIAIAQKCQYLYASKDGRKYDDYDFACEDYEEFLSKYEYSINEKVLEKIDFGDVTLEH